jgi:protein FAM32A
MSFTGGKLKLKGGADLPGVKKKKKKKDKDTQKAVEAALEGEAAQEGAPAASDGTATAPPPEDRRTEAEKRFEAHLAKYEDQRLKKAASKSHRERVKEMNEKLATLTEHHDVPRISYSYM